MGDLRKRALAAMKAQREAKRKPEVTYADCELLDWVSANTDPALSNEARYWQALKAFRDRSRELAEALRPFSDAVYNDNGDVTIEHPGPGDYMRAKRVLAKK